MAAAGGGWMMALHSVAGSASPSTDIVANAGIVSPGLTNGFTRDLSYWAVDQPAQIRHRIIAAGGNVLFDGYYTGSYHGTMAAAASWTTLSGSLATSGLLSHTGKDWSTASNDVDDILGNCAASFGNPWYYSSCWSVLPTGELGTNGPYSTVSGALQSYDIFVRELNTPPAPVANHVPEPASLALLGLGLAGLGFSRRRNAKPNISHHGLQRSIGSE